MVALLCPLCAVEAPSLETCRKVDRMWLGVEEGIVRPLAFKQFRPEIDGEITLHAAEGAVLVKGQHWATIDEQQLDIERRSFEVEKIKIEQQRIKSLEDMRAARRNRAMELRDAENKRDGLEAVCTDADMSPKLRARAKEALGQMNEQIADLQKRMASDQSKREQRVIEEDCQLQLIRKRKQLDALERRSLLVAEFNGRLRYSHTVVEQLQEGKNDNKVRISSGELLGTLLDESRYEIVVPANGPLLDEIPLDQMAVFLQDPQSGRMIPSDYQRIEEIDNGREITRNFIFAVRKEENSQIRLAQGARNMVHVYRKFPNPVRTVMKKDIVFLAPDVLERAGWSGLVEHLWHGSKVIQVGPQTIAIEPKHAD